MTITLVPDTTTDRHGIARGMVEVYHAEHEASQWAQLADEIAALKATFVPTKSIPPVQRARLFYDVIPLDTVEWAEIPPELAHPAPAPVEPSGWVPETFVRERALTELVERYGPDSIVPDEPENYCKWHDLFDCPYAHAPDEREKPRRGGKYRRDRVAEYQALTDVADPPWWQRATAWGKQVGARVERRLQQVGEPT